MNVISISIYDLFWFYMFVLVNNSSLSAYLGTAGMEGHCPLCCHCLAKCGVLPVRGCLWKWWVGPQPQQSWHGLGLGVSTTAFSVTAPQLRQLACVHSTHVTRPEIWLQLASMSSEGMNTRTWAGNLIQRSETVWWWVLMTRDTQLWPESVQTKCWQELCL